MAAFSCSEVTSRVDGRVLAPMSRRSFSWRSPTRGEKCSNPIHVVRPVFGVSKTIPVVIARVSGCVGGAAPTRSLTSRENQLVLFVTPSVMESPAIPGRFTSPLSRPLKRGPFW